MSANDVVMNVTDGALSNVTAPPASVQPIIGCSVGGTAYKLFQSASKSDVIAEFTDGPIVQAACLVIDAGGTAIVVKTPTTTAGTCSAVTHTGTGTSVVTVTGAPIDDLDVLVKVTTAGTIGASAGIKISLDNGRTYGAEVALGTAVTYVIGTTGITLHFAAGTLVLADLYAFLGHAPLWAVADVATALTTLQNSSLSWGAPIHVVGKCAASDATTIQASADTMFTQNRFVRIIVEARDVDSASSESESTWIAAIQTDYAAAALKRVCVGAGAGNVQSAIKTTVAGAPVYRRPLSWAAAARAVAVPFWEHLGRVRTGTLKNFSFPSAANINDGRVYHDERPTPGLDASRFMTVHTFTDFQGIYIKNANLMAPAGSDFSQLQYGTVMDQTCSITRQVLINYINDTVRLYKIGNPKQGRILEQDAVSIETAVGVAYNANLIGIGAVSDVTVKVNRTDDISVTRKIRATVAILSLGYIEEIDVDIGFANPVLVAA